MTNCNINDSVIGDLETSIQESYQDKYDDSKDNSRSDKQIFVILSDPIQVNKQSKVVQDIDKIRREKSMEEKEKEEKSKIGTE